MMKIAKIIVLIGATAVGSFILTSAGPAAAQDPNAVPEIRFIGKGETLREVLARWSADAGVELLYDDPPEEDVMAANREHQGTFTQAVLFLLEGLSARPGRPIGIFSTSTNTLWVKPSDSGVARN